MRAHLYFKHVDAKVQIKSCVFFNPSLAVFVKLVPLMKLLELEREGKREGKERGKGRGKGGKREGKGRIFCGKLINYELTRGIG